MGFVTDGTARAEVKASATFRHGSPDVEGRMGRESPQWRARLEGPL